jgi:hypothetical protein
MTYGLPKKKPLKGLDWALGRLDRAAATPSRRKRWKGARMDASAKEHAAAFLKVYYDREPTVDPRIGVRHGGGAYLDWLYVRLHPNTDEPMRLYVFLTIIGDGSYDLELIEYGRPALGRGRQADFRVAHRIARLAEGNHYTCIDCTVDTDKIDEYYVVRDDVWRLAETGELDGMLCIACLENRIGRQLTPVDFIDAPINDPGGWPHSDCLKHRLGHA